MAVTPTLNDIRVITPVLEEKLNLDIYNYALSFLRRRFSYVFNALNIKTVKGFVNEVEKGNLLDDFMYYFLTDDTEMFRDPSFWRTLKNKILPQFEGGINIWIPELVSCDELFSLLVVLKEDNLLSRSTIYCNVSCLKRIEEAKNGWLDGKKFEISKQNFKRLELSSKFDDYFIFENKSIYVGKALLNGVNFISGSFFNKGPDVEIDIAIFRNRMIYFNSKLQQLAEKEILKYMCKDAFMAIGIKEEISDSNEHLFESYDKHEHIYKV